MGIVFGAVAPHGFEIIPRISEDAGGGLKTRAAMEELGRRFDAANVDAIVLAGPHGIRVEGHIAVSVARRAAGQLARNGNSVELNVPIDLDLARAIADQGATDGVPTARVSWGGNRISQAGYPITWDSLTPLWFMGHGRHVEGLGNVLAADPEGAEGPPVVIVAPSRDLSRQDMIQFGRSIADAAEASGKRVAFIASCDWAHTHVESGPYGAHPSAAPVDAKIVASIENDDLKSQLELSEDEVQTAAIDGMWQTLMLAGIRERVTLKPELLCYEVPTYFGMIVAAYSPA
ncbi:MAG TPA: aromatic ring-opening dioxygenase subunit LigB [Thermomicrobiales bacterium]|jgi:aromatic ring-opening dioxygenase LigB subunit|nr:aromatic ring-opening dioxygenase subunit LigB [Thermomicrobiales bacterium]